jgi:amidophosphoribosyltransferase
MIPFVRGTTSEQIIRMARKSGKRRVYFASAAPPVRYPNVLQSIDMPAACELIAHHHSEEEIAQTIGADYPIFQDLSDLEHAVQRGNPGL